MMGNSFVLMRQKSAFSPGNRCEVRQSAAPKEYNSGHLDLPFMSIKSVFPQCYVHCHILFLFPLCVFLQHHLFHLVSAACFILKNQFLVWLAMVAHPVFVLFQHLILLSYDSTTRLLHICPLQIRDVNLLLHHIPKALGCTGIW